MLELYEKKGRKIYIVIIIAVILFLTFLLFLQQYMSINSNIAKMKELEEITPQPAVLQDDSYNGQVEYIEGSVEVRDSASAGWFSVQKSQIVKGGNEIRTLSDARAIVTFEDGSSVRLDENTHIVFSNANSNIHITMDGGEVYNKVAKDDTRVYAVRAGDYTVTALGTEFGVEDDEESVDVMVVESAVDVKDKDGNVLDQIDEGNKAEIQSDSVEKKAIEKKDLEEEFIAWNREKDKKKDDDKKKDEDKKTEKEDKEKNDDVDYAKGSITLSGKESSSGVRLHWDTSGISAPKGFKIVKSKEKNPVYPGDDYKYISDPHTRDYKWKISTGKEYYFRVCVYNGHGGCGTYSNNVHLDTPSGDKDDDDKDGYATKVSLSADEDDGDVKLKWDISGGKAPKGFKIVKSKSKNPEYPGDDYKYVDSDTRKYKWKGFKKGKTYYFRVCIYKGGKCGTYSNNVKVEF